MPINAENSDLKQIPIKNIDKNPDNPRVVFRQKELEELLESIKIYGVQVPIAVYKVGKRFVLIDGERRWRCCHKLNLKTIPALIQKKPSKLENLLLMFNIHALREQWDLFTIALKLTSIIEGIKNDSGKTPNEQTLAQKTGLTRSVIRRCKMLIELPEKHKNTILIELKKPKHLQKFSEDFFIEMERALKTTERAIPDLIKDKEKVREVLIEKYEKDVIKNIVHFRDMAKIARSVPLNLDKNQKAETALKKLFKENEYSIEQAFNETVSEAYTEKDITQKISSLTEQLNLF